MNKLDNRQLGHLHPNTHVINTMLSIFIELGFSVVEGKEIETEQSNFDVLNFPQDHPARDMQDTFWLEPEELKRLLRTQTSDVQVPYMREHTPPFAIVSPGRVFRNEATDSTHEAQFYQMEGLLVGEKVGMAHLKYVLEVFIQKLFGEDVSIILRPGYFPFVEPGVEVDMVCGKCAGDGCTTCKQNGWIEILGAGKVHPNILHAGGIDPQIYSGFAFGIGVDRVSMLKYGIDDIRRMYTGDLRFINQF